MSRSNGHKGTQGLIFEKLAIIRALIRKRVCLLTRIPFPVTTRWSDRSIESGFWNVFFVGWQLYRHSSTFPHLLTPSTPAHAFTCTPVLSYRHIMIRWYVAIISSYADTLMRGMFVYWGVCDAFRLTFNQHSSTQLISVPSFGLTFDALRVPYFASHQRNIWR